MNDSRISKKKFLLFVFSNLKTIYGRTYIQKLIFVMHKRLKINELKYDAYFYGPYSQELNNLTLELVNEGLVSEEIKKLKNNAECYTYTLTENGKLFLEKNDNEMLPEEKESIKSICAEFSNFTPTQLLKYVYKMWPESAANSIFFDN